MIEKNLTKGSIVKNLILFSIPYLIACFLQTFYGLADLFITGQFNGASSITAVANGSQIMHMITVVIAGLAMGASVVIGRAVGEKNREDIGKAIINTTILFVGFSIVLTGVLLLSVNGINNLLDVPAESVKETSYYLYVCFIGIPFIVGYNVVSSIFRGLGDSTTPMVFVFLAGIINIILDYLLIGYYGMGALGAAIATITAQAISFISSVVYIRYFAKGFEGVKFSFKLESRLMKKIINIGLPIALQDGFIQIAFLTITMIANSRGVQIAAAVGIVEKIISFVFLVPSAMLSTVSAIASQNAGAKKDDRAKKTLFYGIGISFTIGLVISGICQFISSDVVALFTKDSAVIVYGSQYLRSYIFDCAIAAVHFCFSGFFVAYQKSLIPFVHNILSIIAVRIPGAYFASIYFPGNLFPMGAAAPLGSLLSAIICIIAYRIFFAGEKMSSSNL